MNAKAKGSGRPRKWGRFWVTRETYDFLKRLGQNTAARRSARSKRAQKRAGQRQMTAAHKPAFSRAPKSFVSSDGKGEFQRLRKK